MSQPDSGVGDLEGRVLAQLKDLHKDHGKGEFIVNLKEFLELYEASLLIVTRADPNIGLDIVIKNSYKPLNVPRTWNTAEYDFDEPVKAFIKRYLIKGFSRRVFIGYIMETVDVTKNTAATLLDRINSKGLLTDRVIEGGMIQYDFTPKAIEYYQKLFNLK